MLRSLLIPFLVLSATSAAGAATLEGRVVNGTTGEEAHADLVELIDLTVNDSPVVTSVEDVTGSFTLTDIPDAAAAHFRLIVHDGETEIRQSIENFRSFSSSFSPSSLS